MNRFKRTGAVILIHASAKRTSALLASFNHSLEENRGLRLNGLPPPLRHPGPSTFMPNAFIAGTPRPCIFLTHSKRCPPLRIHSSDSFNFVRIAPRLFSFLLRSDSAAAPSLRFVLSPSARQSPVPMENVTKNGNSPSSHLHLANAEIHNSSVGANSVDSLNT